MVAIPVLFERNGQIIVKLGASDNNGVKDVIMNPETNSEGSTIQVIPVRLFFNCQCWFFSTFILFVLSSV